MDYSHNMYLDSDSCQQQRNTAEDCQSQQLQQQKDYRAQGPFNVVGFAALNTSRQAAPAASTAIGSATRLDVTRGFNFNLSYPRQML